MKRTILLILLFSISKLLLSQQFIIEVGRNNASQTSFLNTALKNDFSGYNLSMTYHQSFKKVALEYRLLYNQFNQNPSNDDIYDGVGITFVEGITSHILPKINSLSLEFVGLFSIYKKNIYLTISSSIVTTFKHEGSLKSEVVPYVGGKSIEFIEYDYLCEDAINPTIGIGTFLIFPISKKINISTRVNLTSLFGTNKFVISKNIKYRAEESRTYISDYVTAAFGVGYVFNRYK